MGDGLPELVVRKADGADLPALVDLHIANVGSDEFSMLLGRRFITSFYRLCLSHQQSDVTVLCMGERIIGVAMHWRDHYGISRDYRRQILLPLGWYLVGKVLTLQWPLVRRIVAYSLAGETYRIPADVAPFCMEMTILDQSARTDVRKVTTFFRMFSDSVERLRQAGNGALWASAQSTNRNSMRMIEAIIKPTEKHVLRRQPTEVTCFISRRPDLLPPVAGP